MQAIDIQLHQAVTDTYTDIYTTYGLLKKRLDRSALTPSRLGGDV